MTRVRVDHELSVGEVVSLGDDHAHHLSRVLRVATGAEVMLMDAAGVAWAGTVTSVAPGAVEVRVVAESADAGDATPRVSLTVWVPLLKGGRTDDLVRQLTELGATRIVPYASLRTVARVDGAKAARKLERWRVIAREATRQCGRADEPVIDAVAGLPADGCGVFLWEEGGPPARDVLAARVTNGELAVLIGPEGGLDAAEAARLEAAGWAPASLGPRVLRAETAVVAAAVLALHALGEGGY